MMEVLQSDEYRNFKVNLNIVGIGFELENGDRNLRRLGMFKQQLEPI